MPAPTNVKLPPPQDSRLTGVRRTPIMALVMASDDKETRDMIRTHNTAGGRGMTRAGLLRTGALALASGLATACGAAATGGTTAATQVPATPAPRNVTLIVDNDWTAGDRLTIIKAWLDRANKIYPNIKTDLRDTAGDQSKTIALFAAD